MSSKEINTEALDSKHNLSFVAQFSKSIVNNIPSRLSANEMHHLKVDYHILSDVILLALISINREDSIKHNHFCFMRSF